MMRQGPGGEDRGASAFGTIGEIEFALQAKAIKLHDKIRARFETVDPTGAQACASPWSPRRAAC